MTNEIPAEVQKTYPIYDLGSMHTRLARGVSSSGEILKEISVFVNIFRSNK